MKQLEFHNQKESYFMVHQEQAKHYWLEQWLIIQIVHLYVSLVEN